jgi:hypothetical protein
MIALAEDRSVCPRPAASTPAAGYDRFLELLPTIRRHARYAFRHLLPEGREEAIQEVVANAFVAYTRLVEQGKEELAYATPLARHAVAQVRAGRRVGGKLNVRDVSSDHCRRTKGVKLERLDRWDQDQEAWREILVEDKTCTPADLAASRIDYRAFLATLGRRNRRIAQMLATGDTTSRVAEQFGLSLARVSQLRQELKAAWEAFQGEPSTGAAAGAA